jgi:hypothetical protein
MWVLASNSGGEGNVVLVRNRNPKLSQILEKR